MDFVEALENMNFVGGDLIQPTFTQFQKIGDGFAPSGPTVETIPAGVYEVVNPNSPYFYQKNILTDHLLELPDSKSSEVINEIEKFWSLKPKFRKFGFSFKRGILMYGPPGSGKTCTLNLIAKKMVENGGIVILGHKSVEMLPWMLHRFREVEPNRPMVVFLEDIDSLVQVYEPILLNLLDGEDNIENVVFVATTNYLTMLDKRITNRPSRFDKIVEIGFPDFNARLMYLTSRDLGISKEELYNWAEVTEGLGIAHLKESVVSVMCLGLPLKETVHRLRQMDSLSDERSLAQALPFKLKLRKK